MSIYLTALQSDNFQRVNVSPLTSPWELDEFGDPGLQIVSDLCEGIGTSVNAQLFTYAGGLPNDQYCSVTLAEVPTSGASFSIAIRATDNGSTYNQLPAYILNVSHGGAWQVLKGGEFGGIIFSGSSTIGATDTWTLAVIGTTLYVLQNGVQLGTGTSTLYASGGAFLVSQPDGTVSNVQFSSFVIGSASTTPPSPPPSGSTPFLGSVVIVESVPGSCQNPFLGTVTVIDSAPSGVPNPYLGQVISGAPPEGFTGNNPTLGNVVVIAEKPANIVNDTFLGTVEES